MAITQLTVVNDALALLGELPMNTLDTGHPLVPRALAELANANTRVQATRWWFNTENLTLSPQAGSGEILVPNDTLACDPLDPCAAVALRGNKLYNLNTQSVVWSSPVAVRLHREIPFEDAPITARSYIAALALRTFQRNYDGDSSKTRDLKQDEQTAYIAMNAEHIRNTQANMLRGNPTLERLAEIHGHRAPIHSLRRY